jgi:hypothetical protein
MTSSVVNIFFCLGTLLSRSSLKETWTCVGLRGLLDMGLKKGKKQNTTQRDIRLHLDWHLEIERVQRTRTVSLPRNMFNCNCLLCTPYSELELALLILSFIPSPCGSPLLARHSKWARPRADNVHPVRVVQYRIFFFNIKLTNMEHATDAPDRRNSFLAPHPP